MCDVALYCRQYGPCAHIYSNVARVGYMLSDDCKKELTLRFVVEIVYRVIGIMGSLSFA